MSKDTSKETLLQRRKSRQKGRGNSETADWGGVDSEKVLRLIEIVTKHNGTITFGYTRDGGAYFISYFIDGEQDKNYIRPTEDINLFFDSEIEAFNEL